MVDIELVSQDLPETKKDKKLEATPEIEKHLTANMNLSKKDIVVGNFLGGLAWGVGSVVGVALIGFAIGMLLNALGVFSAIGTLFAPINELKNLNQGLPQVPKL